MEAMYNIGYIYKDGLSDFDRSIDAYDAFLKRFDECKFTLPAYYDMYRIYEEKEDAVKMDYYKNLILSKYPNSDYAKIISDPEYYKKLEAERNKVSVYYKATYMLYEQGQYDQVIRNADSALKVYNDKGVIPKFEYLKALAIGKSKDKNLFISALQNVIAKYPKSEVAPPAQNILDFLQGKVTPAIVKQEVKAGTDSVSTNPALPELYKYDPSGFHFYIVVMDARTIKINDVKNAFSDHNIKYYSTAKLTVNSLFLDDKHEVLNVGRFDNKEKGMEYISSVLGNQTLIAKIGQGNYRHFILSANNYAAFYKSKDVDRYIEFYNKNYNKK
jgi:tetratricopeptide (TPR) repeat protein